MTAFTTNRYNFTSIFFGFLAITSLVTLAGLPNLNTIVQIGLVAVSIIATALIFLVPYGKVSLITNIIGGKLEITGDQKISSLIFPRTIDGENKKIETLIGLDNPFRQFEDVSDEEQIIRNSLHAILENGFNETAVKKAVEICESFKPVGKVSFRHPLNKARLLGLLGRISETEKIANEVIKDYAENYEAVGTAYEVLAWVEDFREPYTKNVVNSNNLYKKWLDKRKDYTTKGLEYFQSGHALLMNAFELSVLENNAKEAIDFLKRAFSSNDGKTQAKLVVHPLLQEAKNLSSELGNMIQEIINGDFNMQSEPDTNIFQLIRKQTLIVILITIVALLMLAFSFQIPRKQFLNFLPKNVMNNFAFLTKCDGGTDLGQASINGGTDLGQVSTLFSSLGGGTDLGRVSVSLFKNLLP